MSADDSPRRTSPDDELQLVLVHKAVSETENLDKQTKAELLEARESLSSDTGYLMAFTDLRHAQLTVHDIDDVVENKYPVPRAALESLPAHIRADLSRPGGIKFFARYNRDKTEFYDVSLPTDEVDVPERVAELMSRLDCSVQEAVDYVIVDDLEKYSAETWSNVRDVQKRQVQRNTDTVRERLQSASSDAE